MVSLIELYFETAAEWRSWLREHHDQEAGAWLIFYRKGTPRPSIDYEAAVDEALCYGWIDSLIRKIDEARYARKFTPRNEVSKWSASNKRRVEQLIREQRMTEFGMAKVEAAKRNGVWDKSDRPVIPEAAPAEFLAALERNKTAKAYFEQLAPTYQKQYIAWIVVAKRTETRQKRIKEAIELLEKGEKLGLR